MPPTSVTRRVLSLLLCLGALQGCSQWRYELGSPLAETQTPREADTPSLAAVLANLGPPTRVSALPAGYVLAWDHWRISEDTVGFSLNVLGVDFLSVDWGDARMRGESVLATFNRRHELTGAAFAQWDSHAGGSTSMQPLFGVSLVEVDDLVAAMPVHRWGATSLDRLPAALNAANRPGNGRAGIQQRGTPTGIGQQTLELE